MPSDTPVFSAIVIIVLTIISLAIVAIIGAYQNPKKASQRRSTGGYRPSTDEEGRPLVINPPKAPKGRGAASN